MHKIKIVPFFLLRECGAIFCHEIHHYDQPRSQSSLSCFEKEPRLRLVKWKCVSINCEAGVGPQINFVFGTMKYHLG